MQQQVFPQYETKVYRTSRRKKSLLKVLVADFGRAHHQGSSSNVEPAHNTTKLLCPNETVRVSISPVLLKTKN